jgi:hypothetical protein
MRGLWFGILLLTVSTANAGPVLFANQQTLFGTSDRDMETLSTSYPQAPSLTGRSVGLDALASHLGLSGGRLTFYEYTDRPGTDRETRMTLGVGGKGLVFRVVW